MFNFGLSQSGGMLPLAADTALPIALTGGIVLAASILLTLLWMAYLSR